MTGSGWSQPHVTVLHKTRAWRIGLRKGAFLDDRPPPRDVPDEVVAIVEESLQPLRDAWDQMYPENPAETEDDDA